MPLTPSQRAFLNGCSSPRSIAAYQGMRRYERRLLPPLSAASLIGIALFVIYIGSALYSVVPERRQQTAASLKIQRAQERKTCRALPPPNSSCLGSYYTYRSNVIDTERSQKPRKVLYVQPFGALGSRLRGVASGLTLGADQGADVVIVWADAEYGYTGAWDSLFSAPELPLGCFPGESQSPETASCPVHTITSRTEWLAVKDRWQPMTVRGEAQEVLCIRTVMYLTDKQREIAWFYQLLVPAAEIQADIASFMTSQNWTDPGTTWVGVHARRTDLKLKCTTVDCTEGISAETALPLSRFTDIMKQVASYAPITTNVRFYLATDDPKAEQYMKEALERERAKNRLDYRNNASYSTVEKREALMGNSSNYHLPTTVSMPKRTRDSANDWLAMRSVVTGVQEAVADLYLLSRCHVLIGTVGSTFSQTARLMGEAFYLTVGVEYENKLY